MARTIIRYSLNDENAAQSAPVDDALGDQDFTKIGTRLWERTSGSALDQLAALRSVLDELHGALGGGAGGGVQLDHLWVYSDGSDAPAAKITRRRLPLVGG